MADVLIYGSYGYTGKLIVDLAIKTGLNFVIGGRNGEKVRAQAEKHGVEGLVFDMNDEEALRKAVSSVKVVIHVAGPFMHTTPQMIEACIKSGTHYLDTCGEHHVFEFVRKSDAAAKAAGVMLMPGAGWDVVPSDCIAAYVAQKVRGEGHTPLKLLIGLEAINGIPSRGTLRTSMEMVHKLLVSKDGEFAAEHTAPLQRELDFGFGPIAMSLFPSADLISAHKSTGIADIATYMASSVTTGLVLPEGGIEAYPEGPTQEQLDVWRSFCLAEVLDETGRVTRAVAEMHSGYEVTAEAIIEIANRCLAGNFKAGYQSPASAYGYQLVTDLKGTITDLPDSKSDPAHFIH